MTCFFGETLVVLFLISSGFGFDPEADLNDGRTLCINALRWGRIRLLQTM